jgi:hypothetical protein
VLTAGAKDANIFYATTPPGLIFELLCNGCLKIGNFVLSAASHLFLRPLHALAGLVTEGSMVDHRPFMKNRGDFVLRHSQGSPAAFLRTRDFDENNG